MLLCYLALLSIVIGWLRGGRLHNFLHYSLRGLFLPIAAFLLEAGFEPFFRLTGWEPSRWLWAAVLTEYLLIFSFLFLNRQEVSTWFLAAGTAANFLVIACNGWRMPVSAAIYEMPSLSSFVERIEAGTLMEYCIAGPSTRFLWLGDVIHFDFIPGMSFASVGDFFMAVGVFLLIQAFMTARPPQASTPASEASYG
ncbi:MAG: DUF5317 domain-containing protein [Oscillospiraceae bacterium]|nr:DUF5317 domain-containing protein [Oscillospiraceae bacterium]